MSKSSFIATVGCSLISSSVGNHADLLLSDREAEAYADLLARYPFFAATPSSIVSLVGTVNTTTIAPLVQPEGAGTAGSFDPMPFPGYIVQILGSDLDRIVGNTFTLSWVFASLRYGATGAVTHTATLQLDKPGARGTFVGIIPANVVSGKSRLASPHIWRPSSTGAPADTLSIAALATGTTAQVRMLTHHDGAFPDLWPDLHVKLQEKA